LARAMNARSRRPNAAISPLGYPRNVGRIRQRANDLVLLTPRTRRPRNAPEYDPDTQHAAAPRNRVAREGPRQAHRRYDDRAPRRSDRHRAAGELAAERRPGRIRGGR